MFSADQIKDVKDELRREIQMRERVYPKWVASENSRLTQAQADRQLERLRNAMTLIDMIDTAGRVVRAEYEPGSEKPDRIQVAYGNEIHWFERVK